jgi:hypothetical protein
MRFLLVLLALVFSSRAAAHAVAVDMDTFIEDGALVVLMGDPNGLPINNAKLEFVLYNEQGSSFNAVIPQTAQGEYRVRAPDAPAGAYTLVLRDSTFPGEALEARADVRYPLAKPVRLRLPPSPAGAPSVSLLVVLTLAPVGLSLLVLAFILIARPKVKALEPIPSSPEAPREETR